MQNKKNEAFNLFLSLEAGWRWQGMLDNQVEARSLDPQEP
jgi:hypothetical protein